jgi:Membrane bound beta barrel domain (DUF5777)
MRGQCAPVLVAAVLLVPAGVAAQPTPATEPATQPEQADPDVRVDPLQPDFALAALPTTLRMPRHKWYFRVTHRFTRSLSEGDFGDLVGNAFGVDGSAQVGLELRFGLFRGTQIGVHRTSERTIQIFGQHNFLTERNGAIIGLDAIATIEGRNNLRDDDNIQSTLGVIMSRNMFRFAALYVEPMFVINSSPFVAGDQNTFMLGLGARLRVRPSMYLVGEITPRLAGYDLNVNQIGFGAEFRAGGHLFQINISNGFGTTLGQVAGGGIDYDQWYLGFNIARKFF